MACSRPLKMIIVGDPCQLPPPLAVTTATTTTSTSSSTNKSATLTAFSFNTAPETSSAAKRVVDGTGNGSGNGSGTGSGLILPSSFTRDLSRTLFDRLLCNGWSANILRTQYRCHPEIASVCSELFYEGRLLSGICTSDRPALVCRNTCTILPSHSLYADSTAC